MKRFIYITILTIILCVVCSAQSGTSGRVRYGAALPSTCSPLTGDLFFLTTGSNGLYQCLSTNTWTRVAVGGGSGTVNPGTANQLAYYPSTASSVSGLASGNNGTLVTNGSGVPSISSTLPNAVQDNITRLGTIANIGASLGITFGGTGAASFTAGNIFVGNGTSSFGGSSDFTYGVVSKQLKVGNNGSLTVPYTTTSTNVTTETFGASQTISNDQTFSPTDVFAGSTGGASGTASVNNGSTVVTINSGAYVFSSADIGKTFTICTGGFCGSPFFTSTIASVTDATHFNLASPSTSTLSTQSYFLESFLNNVYSTVIGNHALSAMSGATVVGFNAHGNNSSQYANLGFQGNSYGGYPVIIGAYAGDSSKGFGTCVGSFTQCGNAEAVAIGPSTKAQGLATFALGDKAECIPSGPNGNEICMGDTTRAEGNGDIMISFGGYTALDGILFFGLGDGLGQSRIEQFASGNTAAFGGGHDGQTTGIGGGYQHFWFGNADTINHAPNWVNTTPANLDFNGTGASGSNVAGATITWKAPPGTGNATPGSFIISSASATTSGSTAQTQTNRFSVDGLGNINALTGSFIQHNATYTGVVGTTTFDLATGNSQTFTFGAGNETIALSNIKVGVFAIVMIQDATGSRTATWPASIKWVGASAPTLSTGAAARDQFLFLSDGTNLYELSRALNVH